MQQARIMRTTVSIDDRLLAAAKRRAREQDKTLGAVLEDALRRELALREPRDVPRPPVFSGGSGLRPGIDPASNRSLREALDDRDAAGIE